MLPLFAVLIATMLLAACSPSAEPEQNAAATQAQDQRAQQDLKLYETMRTQGKYELAAPIGQGIVDRAPDSQAAAEVRKTLAETQEKADAINEERRLKRLWLYQTSPMSGGTQHTATLYPSRPVRYNRRLKLILRRHSDWGQSVYLYDTSDAGFVCKNTCELAFTVDGKKEKALKASLPPTGEPAIFIDSGKRFLKAMEHATDVTITVNLKDDGGQKLYFEVGGFDPERWPKAEGK